MKCKGCDAVDIPIIDPVNKFCQLCYNHYRMEAYQVSENIEPMLPTGSKERKQIPVWSGLFKYFPKALISVSQQSMIGHLQHYKPDEPMHWDRSKSADDWDALLRHMISLQEAIDAGDKAGIKEHAGAVAWRGLAVTEKALDL